MVIPLGKEGSLPIAAESSTLPPLRFLAKGALDLWMLGKIQDRTGQSRSNLKKALCTAGLSKRFFSILASSTIAGLTIIVGQFCGARVAEIVGLG